jgi:hypothetical protein
MSEEFQGYTLKQIEEMVLWELGQNVSDGNLVYGRFPKRVLRRKLNERQNLFVSQSRCLRKVGLLVCKAGYRTYKLPANCMDSGVMAAQYFYAANSYINLIIRDIQWLHEHQQGWLITAASTPQWCFMGESYGNIGTLGVHPKPKDDGTNYTADPDTGVTIGTDLPSATSNVTGTATGGSTTSLIDTATDFTDLGLVAGMAVNNLTTAEDCNIVTVAEHTLTTTASTTGFSAGDHYEILSGEYGVVTSWENDEAYLFGSEVGVISNITVPPGNIRIDYIPYPRPFPETGGDNLYPEIPRLYHHALAMGVVADCLQTFQEKTKEFQRAQAYEQKFNAYFAAGASQANKRPFSDKPVGFAPARRR